MHRRRDGILFLAFAVLLLSGAFEYWRIDVAERAEKRGNTRKLQDCTRHSHEKVVKFLRKTLRAA